MLLIAHEHAANEYRYDNDYWKFGVTTLAKFMQLSCMSFM